MSRGTELNSFENRKEPNGAKSKENVLCKKEMANKFVLETSCTTNEKQVCEDMVHLLHFIFINGFDVFKMLISFL